MKIHCKHSVRFLFFVLAIPLLILGCHPPEEAPPPSNPAQGSSASPKAPAPEKFEKTKLRIAAASDLKFVFASLNQEFEKQHPEIFLEPSFGASGTFYAQITQNAPFDLFLSADENFPQQLIEKMYTVSPTPFRYAEGHLVLWVLKTSPLDIENLGLRVLLDERVKRIGIANPKTAPYGRAAKAALESNELWSKVESRIILGENAAQTTQFAESGNVDIGLLPLSHALSEPLESRGRYWAIPAGAHPRIIQAGVILKNCEHIAAAEEFQKFLLSPAARASFRKFGLMPQEELSQGNTPNQSNNPKSPGGKKSEEK